MLRRSLSRPEGQRPLRANAIVVADGTNGVRSAQGLSGGRVLAGPQPLGSIIFGLALPT